MKVSRLAWIRLLLPLSATDASIFFPKFMDGIWRFSVKTSQLTRMWNSDEYIVGIAFDAARNITYWTSGYTIYRATINQTETETLLNSTADRKCKWHCLGAIHWICGHPKGFGIIADGSFNGLAYDWIADNLYVATHRFVLSCNYDATFRCVTLVSGQGLLNGIALDPNEGYKNFVVFWLNPIPPCLKLCHFDLAPCTFQDSLVTRMNTVSSRQEQTDQALLALWRGHRQLMAYKSIFNPEGCTGLNGSTAEFVPAISMVARFWQ